MRRPSRGRGVRAVLGLVAALGTGCSASTDPGAGVVLELEAARARWEARGFDDYSWVVTRGCFCIREATGEVRVAVRGGRVVSAVRLDDGTAVDDEWLALFPGVEGLFDLVEDALRRGADSVRVDFDPELGAPLAVRVDEIAEAVDDEWRYDATVPSPLP